MLSKKGHVPTLLLFLFSVILVAAAWFSFLSFDGNINDKEEELYGAVHAANFEREFIEFVFTRMVDRTAKKADVSNFIVSFNQEFKSYALRVDEKTDISGNFFGKIRNGEFNLTLQEEIYNITLNDISIIVDSNNNELKQTFNLTVSFNETGVIQ